MQNNKLLSFSVGIFVLAALLALTFLAFRTSNMNGFKAKDSYLLNAYFSDISGLSKNATVTLAGVQIGKVKAITLDLQRFQAEVILEIDSRFNQLPRDSSADILTAGLLGEKYIGLMPGGELQMLADGDTIQYTGASMVIEKLIQQFVTELSLGDERK